MKPRAKRPLSARFWEKVDTSGGSRACWPWRASALPRGYGQIAVDSSKPGRSHRVAYELSFGPIPAGMVVMHTCDNPPCCNPAHLRVGTHRDNLADMRSKGRQSRGETHGAARLTRAAVIEIRRSAAAGDRYVDLAARFGVDRRHVGEIVAFKKWSWLKEVT